MHGRGFGGRVEHRAEGDVVGAGGQRGAGAPWFVIAGGADQQCRSAGLAGLGDVAVPAAQVDAVGAGLDGQPPIVVDDQEQVQAITGGAQGAGLFQPLGRFGQLAA